MNNVKPIFGWPTGVPEPNQDCIDVIKQMLEKAEAGEIIGISVAMLRHDGLASWQLGGRVGGFSMLGAMEIARDELVSVIRGYE